MNNKLTDEKIKARINAIEDRRSASRDFWDGDWDYPEDIELLALRELQERRKADNQEPAGYHVVRECGKVGCSVATLEEAKKTRDFWNKKWTISPYFYTAPPAPVADADPVVFTDERNLHHIARGRETSLIWGKQNQEVGDIPLYRHAQPVPVDKEFIPKNLDKALGVVGVALPESKEEFNFQIERWIQRLIDRVIRYADEFKEQPVPVVPDEWTIQDAVKFCRETGRQDAGSAMEAWNACRTAMLNGGKS